MGNKIWDSKSLNWDVIGTKLKVHELNKYCSCETREFRERSKHLKRNFEIIGRIKKGLRCQVEKRAWNCWRKILKNDESSGDGRRRLPISSIFTSPKIITD